MAPHEDQHVYQIQEPGGWALNLVWVILVMMLIFIFFGYALPTLQRIGSPIINVPDKFDININQPGK